MFKAMQQQEIISLFLKCFPKLWKSFLGFRENLSLFWKTFHPLSKEYRHFPMVCSITFATNNVSIGGTGVCREGQKARRQAAPCAPTGRQIAAGHAVPPSVPPCADSSAHREGRTPARRASIQGTPSAIATATPTGRQIAAGHAVPPSVTLCADSSPRREGRTSARRARPSEHRHATTTGAPTGRAMCADRPTDRGNARRPAVRHRHRHASSDNKINRR